MVAISFATSTLMYSTVDAGAGAAASWTGRAMSSDGKAVVGWNYNASTGALAAHIVDGDSTDRRCASMWIRAYDVAADVWSTSDLRQACDTSQDVSLVINSRFRSTIAVTACTGLERCAATPIGQQCTPEFPLRLPIATDTADEVKYLSKIIMCTNHSESATTMKNGTDVVWSINTHTGSIPLVEFSEESLTNQAFRLIRPDRGTRPLLLPGATATIFAAASTIRGDLERALSVALVPVDTVVDELVSAGISATSLLKRDSKGWFAFSKCAVALWTTATSYDDVLEPDDVADLMLSSVQIVGGTLGCSSALTAALSEHGGAWPDSVTINRLQTVFDSAAWTSRWRTMLKTLSLAVRLGPG